MQLKPRATDTTSKYSSPPSSIYIQPCQVVGNEKVLVAAFAPKPAKDVPDSMPDPLQLEPSNENENKEKKPEQDQHCGPIAFRH